MDYTPFKFELYPTKQQNEQLVKAFGCSRKVYKFFYHDRDINTAVNILNEGLTLV